MALQTRGVFRLISMAGLGLLLSAGHAAAQTKPAAAPQAALPEAPKPLADTLTGMAKAEYEAGKVLYADKDYDNAIVKFQKSYEISKDPRLLWNVAVCEKNLRRYSRMLSTLRKLLKDGGPLLTTEDKDRADELAKTVEAFVSPLTLTVNEPGATVFVDDDEIGKTPLTEAVMVDVGTRKIAVKKPGFVTVSRSEQVAGGTPLAITIKLVKEIHEGRLIVIAGENDTILIDGKPVAKGRWDGKLASGGHTLRVTAPEMASHQSEVLIQDNKQRRIDVTLDPVATDRTAMWLWIAGGVAVATGAAIGGAFLFAPDDTPPVEGNIDPGIVQLRFGGGR